MNKHKNKKLQTIYLMIPFGIAVITCLIVNYAVDQEFTWSLLVTGSCLFAYLALFALIFGGKHRILWTYGSICVLIIPYLYLIEWTANQFMPEPIYWVFELGLPLSVIWLAACGLVAVIQKLTKANAFVIAGVAVLVFYVSEWLTNTKIDDFIGGDSQSWRLSEHYPVIYFGTAAVLIFIGLTVMAIKHLKKTAS